MSVQTCFQGLAKLLACFAQKLVITAASAHADKVEIQCSAKPCLTNSSKWMIGRDNKDQSINRIRMQGKTFGIGRTGKNSNVSLFGEYCGWDGLALPFFNICVDPWVHDQEASKAWGDESVQRTAVGDQPDMTFDARDKSSNITLHSFETLKHISYMQQHRFTGRCQLHAARRSLK